VTSSGCLDPFTLISYGRLSSVRWPSLNTFTCSQRSAYSGDSVFLFSTTDDPIINSEHPSGRSSIIPPNVRSRLSVTYGVIISLPQRRIYHRLLKERRAGMKM